MLLQLINGRARSKYICSLNALHPISNQISSFRTAFQTAKDPYSRADNNLRLLYGSFSARVIRLADVSGFIEPDLRASVDQGLAVPHECEEPIDLLETPGGGGKEKLHLSQQFAPSRLEVLQIGHFPRSVGLLFSQ